MTELIIPDFIRLLFTPAQMAEAIKATDPFHQPMCCCGCALEFARTSDSIVCWCERCADRADRDGATVLVYGYGRTREQAYTQWQRALEAT